MAKSTSSHKRAKFMSPKKICRQKTKENEAAAPAKGSAGGEKEKKPKRSGEARSSKNKRKPEAEPEKETAALPETPHDKIRRTVSPDRPRRRVLLRS